MDVKPAGINFCGQLSNYEQKNQPKLMFSGKPLLRQPVKDEVAFTGVVIKVKDLLRGLKKMGFSVVEGGKHGVHVEGFSSQLGRSVNVPIPVHGKNELAKGTAQAIAKELGFKNAEDLLRNL